MREKFPHQKSGTILLQQRFFFAQLDSFTFALTFGQGHHLIDSTKIETNFGLKTAVNVVDPDSLRSIDKSSFEQNPTQIRHQTGIATDIQNFSVDVERDLLRAVTGTPNDEKYGKRVSGMDSFKLSIEAELTDLAKILKEIIHGYQSNIYQNGPFSWIDHIGEVKDRPTQDKLDSLLIKKINDQKIDHIWLTVPEIIDWNIVVGFRYSTSTRKPRYYDVSIPDFLETLKSTPTIDTIKQRRIYCVDSDDSVVLYKPAYRFIYAEIFYESDTYVLNNGKWYKINENFANQVNAYFEAFDEYQKTLPQFNDNTEGEYNARVAQENPGSYALLDKKNIKVSSAASPVEPCDLFRDGNEFIHVKRYGGSSVLSHLFNQGLVSGELFQMEEEFRELINQKLEGKFTIEDPHSRPKINQYKVVFAIISESDETTISIPFFSKISLRHAANRLKAIGLEVSIKKISVADETKHKQIFLPQKTPS